MTVSSTISVFCRDGVFRTVYCHLHGEPTWNGRILHTHYATGQQAEALVEHGDIRCLGPRCDKPAGHTLQNPVDGVTAYYGRDSGFRMDSEAREYRSFREAIATESTEEVRFHYVFIDRNLNPQKTKKAPQNGCFFNTPCAPYERKRLLNRMTLIDTGYEWRFFAPFPVKWTQLPLCGSQPHTCCRASRSCIRTSSASR